MRDDSSRDLRTDAAGVEGKAEVSALRHLEALLAQVRAGEAGALAVASALESMLGRVRRDASSPDRARVLLLDDDETSAAVILHRLGREGLEVVHCSDGREVEPRLAERPVDLALLDAKAPGLNGFELLRRLRRAPPHDVLPIILMAWPSDEQDLVRAFELGADDYILKPFSPVELTARVRRLLVRRPLPIGPSSLPDRTTDAEWHH